MLARPARRLRPLLVTSVAFAALATLALSAPSARAEEEFEVHVSHGRVVVSAKGDWHINKEFPWKLTVGDARLDKTKFTLTEKEASVSDAPAGTGKVRGAVCSHEACHTLEKEVTIP
jgi:hypothetical protein